MNNLIFFLRDLKSTGALVPSSKFLVKDAVSILKDKISKSDKPFRVLELGPGTGTLTREITKALRPQDHLDLVEINPHFTRMLRRKFKGSNVRIHFADFLEFNALQPYDYILSSIPYESVPESVSKEIWIKKLMLTTPGGHITYYKYLNFNHFRCRFEKKVVREMCMDEKVTFLNFPPAKIYTLCIQDTVSSFPFLKDQQVPVSA